MKSRIKTALGLLLTVIVFGAITIASSLGAFSTIETTFYEPARLKVIQSKLDDIATYGNEYITNILSKFGDGEGGFLNEQTFPSFTGTRPSNDILGALGKLKQNVNGLDGFRLIEISNQKLHYSTYKNDYRMDGRKRNYQNYPIVGYDYSLLKNNFGSKELDFALIYTPKETSPKVFFDSSSSRIIVSYYYEHSGKSYNAVFYVNPRDMLNHLVSRRVISINDDAHLIGSSDGKIGGIVFGFPNIGEQYIDDEIIRIWNDRKNAFGIGSFDNFDGHVIANSRYPIDEIIFQSEDNDENTDENGIISWNFITSDKDSYMFFGTMFDSSILKLPYSVRLLLLVCAFITMSLIIMILINIRHDDDVVISDIIRKVQVKFLEEYFDKQLNAEEVSNIIKSTKGDISEKIKKTLGYRSKRHPKKVNDMIENSWNDIVAAMSINLASNKGGKISSSEMHEIHSIFQELKTNKEVNENTINSASLDAASGSNLRNSETFGKFETTLHEENNVEELSEYDDEGYLEVIPEDEGGSEADKIEELEGELELLEDEDSDTKSQGASLVELNIVKDKESLEDSIIRNFGEDTLEASDVEELEEIPEASSNEDSIQGSDEVLEEVLDEAPVEQVESTIEVEKPSEVEELEEIEEIEECESLEKVDSEEENLEDVFSDHKSEKAIANFFDTQELFGEDFEVSKNTKTSELKDVDSITIEDKLKRFEEESGNDILFNIARDPLSGIDPIFTMESEDSEYPGISTELEEIIEFSDNDEEIEELCPNHEGHLNILSSKDVPTPPSVQDNREVPDSELEEPFRFSDSEIVENDSLSLRMLENFTVFFPVDCLFNGDFELSNIDKDHNFALQYTPDSFDEEQNTSSQKVEKQMSDALIDVDTIERNAGKVDFDFPDVDDLELVPGDFSGAVPFSFTDFAAKNTEVSSLSLDTIVQGEDGVFHISDNIDSSLSITDVDFQRLVDSVIK